MLLRCLTVLAAAAAIGQAAAQDIPFADVPATDPYANAVRSLVEMGVIAGYPDETFRGEQPVTRYELAVVVGRMMKYFEESLPTGTALRPLPAPAREGIRAMGGPAAVRFLADRSVEVPASILDTPERLATMDDVANMVASAVARLIERVNPLPEQAGGDAL